MINHLKKMWNRFNEGKKPAGYKAPVDNKQFEKNPTKVRTAEVSQFQDEVQDIESRSLEREAFDKKAFEKTKKSNTPGE